MLINEARLHPHPPRRPRPPERLAHPPPHTSTPAARRYPPPHADFAAALARALAAVVPAKPPPPSLHQALLLLTQLAEHQHADLQAALRCAEALRGQQEELQREQIRQAKAVAERDIEAAALKQHAAEEARRNALRQQQLEEEVEALQECNGKLLDQLQALRMDRLGQEGGAGGGGGSLEEQLRVELVRAVLERQEVENRLELKAREVARSERDKEAMEKYYDQKWNSEYKKVRIKLEQTYSLKIVELEEQSKLRLLTIEN